MKSFRMEHMTKSYTATVAVTGGGIQIKQNKGSQVTELGFCNSVYRVRRITNWKCRHAAFRYTLQKKIIRDD